MKPIRIVIVNGLALLALFFLGRLDMLDLSTVEPIAKMGGVITLILQLIYNYSKELTRKENYSNWRLSNSEERLHHTFNTQQSKKRDSEHPNHIEPWEINISDLLYGHPFEVDVHVTDPGSDDLTFTYHYNSQTTIYEYLNNPPFSDPYPSPELNPMDITQTHEISYNGSGTLTLTVSDDDGGSITTDLDIP